MPLQEIKRFTTDSDACMGTMRLEILEVKKVALRDSDTVRDLATEAKFQTDIQAVDLKAMQKKLCLHHEQLRQVESQIQKNDLKHQSAYEKLLDSMNVMTVNEERLLERLHQDLLKRRGRSRSA